MVTVEILSAPDSIASLSPCFESPVSSRDQPIIRAAGISFACDSCREIGSLMFVTLVAVLCHVLPGGSGDCVEEIITDSNLSSITFQSCAIQGQIGIAKWMSEHPIYRANWTLQRYKCAPGHYELHSKA
jgi:hypothetical protein